TAKSALQKLMFERRSKMLSDAAQAYEVFFQSFWSYSTRLTWIADAKRVPLTGESAEAIRALQLQSEVTVALDLRQKMVTRIQDCFTAQAQLMLLGEEKCREKAEALHAAIT